ncbi:FAD-dependent oxidoreductase [Paenibacillus sp. HB172176]|uniref:FAD-dependent oxidoreductase n=1 Tax=Paenibacillus sp. HB172176 TaxID=2493690 RepID=UPI001438C8BD|nr:FAD-dependent oxidoreductase [Paenibacillus sp. HB172176]
MNIWMPGQAIKVIRETDVVVAGGGPSGFAAAVAAARSGARTMLIEKGAFPGGVGTAAMVAAFASGFHDGERHIIGGIFGKMREALYRQGALVKTDNFEPFDPEALSLYYIKALMEAGVELRLHTWVADAAMKGDRLDAVIVQSKSGRQAIRADVFIDATGDADVAVQAGVGYEQGRPSDGLTQPVSMIFALGGVDGDKVIRELDASPGAPFDGHTLGVNHTIIEGQRERVARAKEQGYLARVPRDNIGICWSLPGRPDVMYANFTRIGKIDGTNAEDLTRAEIEGRMQVEEATAFFRDWMPGFENCFLLRTATHAGIRETRRIKGLYTLTEDDVLNLRQFDDVIAQAHYMIDIHDPLGHETEITRLKKGTSYDIPYRALLQDKVSNLLVTGRCISSTHEAMASLRVMAISMALGEAAGTAAALSFKRKVEPALLPVKLLQGELLRHGAILE